MLSVAQIDVADERLVVVDIGHLYQRLNLGGHGGDVTAHVSLLGQDFGVVNQHGLKPGLESLVAGFTVHAASFHGHVFVHQFVEWHEVVVVVEFNECDVVDDIRL